jgi:hypothetical protein
LENSIRALRASRQSIPALVALAAMLWLIGCGDFWQDPYATTSSSGGSTTSTTTLTASPTSVAVGASVTLTATVSPSAATGSVTFYNGSTSIGSSDLNSGTATLSTSFTSAGSESLTATYSGDDTYASSTSNAVTVTVTAAAASRQALGDPAAKSVPGNSSGSTAGNRIATSAYRAAPIHATRAFRATGGVFAARNSEAVIMEGQGAVTLTDTKVSAAAGAGRGVLLYQSSSYPGAPSFSMTGGSLSYACDAASRPDCAQDAPSKEVSRPATLFAVANATAAISITDVDVANRTASDAHRDGTLLTAAALSAWGESGRNGGHAILRAQGTALSGDVIVDRSSTARIAILEDASGNGSTLTGAIDAAGTGKTVSLELDRGSVWTVTGTSYMTNLDGLDLDARTVNNIDGGGHCVYYSGTINGSASHAVFALGGGGFLAPLGTLGLRCE